MYSIICSEFIWSNFADYLICQIKEAINTNDGKNTLNCNRADAVKNSNDIIIETGLALLELGLLEGSEILPQCKILFGCKEMNVATSKDSALPVQIATLKFGGAILQGILKGTV